MGLMNYLAAGAVGGLGEGIQKGSQLLATAWTQQMLLNERAKLDALRDERLYESQKQLQGERLTAERGMQQERMGGQVLLQTQSEQAAEQRQKKDLSAAQHRAVEREDFELQKAEEERQGRLREKVAEASLRSGEKAEDRKDATQLRAEIRQEEIAAAKNQATDPAYLKALHTLTNAKETDFEKAQTELARFKVSMKEKDRQEAIDKADAVTAAAIMRDATLDIDRLAIAANTAKLDGDTDTVTRLNQQIRESQSVQRAARARAAALSGITLAAPATSNIRAQIDQALEKTFPSPSSPAPSQASPRPTVSSENPRTPAIEAALTALSSAHQTGDPKMIAAAQAELDKAMREAPLYRRGVTIEPRPLLQAPSP